MCGAPAATTLGARELEGPVAELNLRAPHIEPTLHELRGGRLVKSGQVQRLVESAEVVHNKFVEIETAIATLSPLQPSGGQAALCVTMQPTQDPRAAAAAQTRTSGAHCARRNVLGTTNK